MKESQNRAYILKILVWTTYSANARIFFKFKIGNNNVLQFLILFNVGFLIFESVRFEY